MSREAMKLALEAAYLAGWNASGEGYNADYPFGDHVSNPEEDAVWVRDRDNALREALAEQPAQQEPVAHPPCKGMNCGITRTDQEHSIECQAEHAAAIAGGQFVKPEQEPVAWMHTMIDDVVIGHRPADIARHPDRWTPLYTAPSPCPTCEALARTVMMDQTAHDTPPAQRTWVGLSDGEIEEILADHIDDPYAVAFTVNHKLMEKNT